MRFGWYVRSRSCRGFLHGAIGVVLALAIYLYSVGVDPVGPPPRVDPKTASRVWPLLPRKNVKTNETTGSRRLSGTVTRSGDNVAIVAAAVVVANTIDPSPDNLLSALTDVNGSWSIPDLAPGVYEVTFAAKGYLPVRYQGIHVLAGGKQDNLDIEMDVGGATVSGTVTGPDAKPISRARVLARSAPGSAPFLGHTRDDGTYSLTLPNGTFALEAVHEDYVVESRYVQLSGSDVVQDFILEPAFVIRGITVERVSGERIPGAFIQVLGSVTTRADASGQFVIRHIRPGQVEISAYADGYATRQPVDLVVESSTPSMVLELALERGFAIRGRVVSAYDRDTGIPNVPVVASTLYTEQQRLTARHVSSNNGEFEVPGLSPGDYILFATNRHGISAFSSPVKVVDQDVDDVVIRMSPGVTISGRVVPPAAARISLDVADDNASRENFEVYKPDHLEGNSDAMGYFTLSNIPSGVYHLRAVVPDGRAGRAKIAIQDQNLSGILINLTMHSSISGRVLSDTGAPMGDVNVTAFCVDEGNPDGYRATRTTTSPDGSYTLIGLESGTYSLAASNERFVSAGKISVTVDGQRERANVTLIVRPRRVVGHD